MHTIYTITFCQLENEINDSSMCFCHFDYIHTKCNKPCSRKSSLGKGNQKQLPRSIQNISHYAIFAHISRFIKYISRFIEHVSLDKIKYITKASLEYTSQDSEYTSQDF